MNTLCTQLAIPPCPLGTMPASQVFLYKASDTVQKEENLFICKDGLLLQTVDLLERGGIINHLGHVPMWFDGLTFAGSVFSRTLSHFRAVSVDKTTNPEEWIMFFCSSWFTETEPPQLTECRNTNGCYRLAYLKSLHHQVWRTKRLDTRLLPGMRLYENKES